MASHTTAKAVHTHHSRTHIAAGASAALGKIGIVASVLIRALGKLVLGVLILHIIGIHRASLVDIHLRINVLSLFYKHAAVKKIPFCKSVGRVDFKKLSLGGHNISFVDITSNFFICGIVKGVYVFVIVLCVFVVFVHNNLSTSSMTSHTFTKTIHTKKSCAKVATAASAARSVVVGAVAVCLSV